MHAAPFIPQIRRYQDWLAAERGLRFDDYAALWRWSTTDIDAFWQTVWDYFDLQSPTPATAVTAGGPMPDVRWFPGAQANYVQQVFRHVDAAHAAGLAAIVSEDERGEVRTLTWPELQRQVASLALHLRAHGVQPGDRVAAYLPNIPEAMVAFLATAAVGGVWSICAPDMGTAAVLDRFRQIAPKVLIACDGVTYGGRALDRSAVVAELRAALPSVKHVLVHRHHAIETIADCADLEGATARNDIEVAGFTPVWLPFEHPLWIVYSSGTTGLPKPIVHGHGGTVIVALALKTLHNDIGCSYEANSFGERYHWYSSTGWVMWNAQMSGLLNGSTCVIYDGNPGGSKEKPDWGVLWRFAARHGVTFFGAGAAFYANCMKAGLELSDCGDLSQVRALGSTGSPLSPEAQAWGTAQFAALNGAHLNHQRSARDSASSRWVSPPGGGEPHAAQRGVGSRGADTPRGVGSRGADMWWCNISGGTDFAGAFIGGNRELPLVPGEMQCRLLGCAVEAWDARGLPVVGEVGELVCTQPLPSMPLYFWGDEGNARYLASYFDIHPGNDTSKPPAWRHGDWLEVSPAGGCTIYGRSDATINRHGLRMGTSELYRAVEALPEVLDSMVVDLEFLGKDSYMPLFVVLREGAALDDALRARIAGAIRTALSPRFVPDAVFHVAEIPRTLSGKKQELPIKKLLLGQPVDRVVNRDAMANPQSLAWFVDFAARRAAAP